VGNFLSFPVAERDWYDIFRKRIAPIAFIVAILALGTRTCKADMAEVELTVSFGAAAADVRSIRVDLFKGDDVEPVASFNRSYGEAGAQTSPLLDAQLDPGMYRVDMTVGTVSGTRHITRAVDMDDRSSITVSIERDLLRDSRGKGDDP
jgi:hypothetical protein